VTLRRRLTALEQRAAPADVPRVRFVLASDPEADRSPSAYRFTLALGECALEAHDTRATP
jgi:hypothetical protein